MILSSSSRSSGDLRLGRKEGFSIATDVMDSDKEVNAKFYFACLLGETVISQWS
jgi:hypothetical protein